MAGRRRNPSGSHRLQTMWGHTTGRRFEILDRGQPTEKPERKSQSSPNQQPQTHIGLPTTLELWYKLEDFRRDFENEIARTPEESTLVIGGHFNSHVGRNSERPGVSGMYGLSTNRTEAEDLVNWCETLNLQLVNTFCPIKNRGTWFNHSHRRWLELDGFIMRRSQRQKREENHSDARNGAIRPQTSIHHPQRNHKAKTKNRRKTTTKHEL